MKKRGYLILEILIYISIASTLILGVMEVSIFYSKIYKKEMVANKKNNFVNIDTEIFLEDSINVLNKFRIDIYENCIEIYYRKDNVTISKYEIAKYNGGYHTSLYRKNYELNNNYVIVYEGEEEIITRNVTDFSVTEKENLIYITIEFKEGISDTFIYEK